MALDDAVTAATEAVDARVPETLAVTDASGEGEMVADAVEQDEGEPGKPADAVGIMAVAED